MTIQELYTEIHGDFNDILSRLQSADVIARIITRFPDDEACRTLPEVWAAGNDADSFHTAHTAKGVCANLSITRLFELVDTATEALRPGNDELRAQTDLDAVIAEYANEYQRVVSAIKAFAEGC